MPGFAEKKDWEPGQPGSAPISYVALGSTRYNPALVAATKRPDMEKSHHKLLGLATGRSGTRYLVKILRNCGIKVGHEGIKRDGTVGMFFAVEDCWYPGHHWYNDTNDESQQHRSHFEFEQVWHFVRDPRKVIPSLANRHFPGTVWCWQERHTGISSGLFPKELRAMLFWVAWNEMIEKNEKIDLFFRIEEIDSVWPRICELLSLPEGSEIPPINRDYGSQVDGPTKPVPMSWEDMEKIDYASAARVREMAERYGYE